MPHACFSFYFFLEFALNNKMGVDANQSLPTASLVEAVGAVGSGASAAGTAACAVSNTVLPPSSPCLSRPADSASGLSSVPDIVPKRLARLSLFDISSSVASMPCKASEARVFLGVVSLGVLPTTTDLPGPSAGASPSTGSPAPDCFSPNLSARFRRFISSSAVGAGFRLAGGRSTSSPNGPSAYSRNLGAESAACRRTGAGFRTRTGGGMLLFDAFTSVRVASRI
mmetsp:Transcript_118929/g.237021  ORF Transcript_118929/g.237021 Transcript_118929/m.237021 type:complete len:226 (+) Transcript_118929:178-855(+)